MFAGQAGDAEQRIGPIAPGHVEPEGASGVRHVLHMFTGQKQPDIGLGQQHLANARIDVRLMLAHPGDLGSGEARHGDIAGNLSKLRQLGFHLETFGGRAPIVP
ncbi:hypothetical protein D3C87_1505270 [compost metagenome]